MQLDTFNFIGRSNMHRALRLLTLCKIRRQIYRNFHYIFYATFKLIFVALHGLLYAKDTQIYPQPFNFYLYAEKYDMFKDRYISYLYAIYV